LYGCETWSLLFKKECGLKVFENSVTRRIYELKRDDVTRKWSRLSKEELNDLYSSANTIRVIEPRRMRWAGHVTRTGENSGAYPVLGRKPE
jgi:hypothetical protein